MTRDVEVVSSAMTRDAEIVSSSAMTQRLLFRDIEMATFVSTINAKECWKPSSKTP